MNTPWQNTLQLLQGEIEKTPTPLTEVIDTLVVFSMSAAAKADKLAHELKLANKNIRLLLEQRGISK